MKVSVRLMTYNHEDFIVEALEGIAMQKVNFDVEVVIGDDFSTDGTLNKIKTFVDNNSNSNPNITFKILERPIEGDYWKRRQKNGRLENFVDIINNCDGQYIALLDGDDYWTDPLKLQKQVDFMEANPDYTICFHHAHVLHPDGSTKDLDWKKENSYEISRYDLGRVNMISTPTILYRNLNIEFPNWYKKAMVGDYPLHLLHAQNGKIYYMKDPMAIYRAGAGIWSSKSSLEIYERVFDLVNSLLDKIQNEEIKKGLLDQNMWLKTKIDHFTPKKEKTFLQKVFKIFKN